MKWDEERLEPRGIEEGSRREQRRRRKEGIGRGQKFRWEKRPQEQGGQKARGVTAEDLSEDLSEFLATVDSEKVWRAFEKSHAKWEAEAVVASNHQLDDEKAGEEIEREARRRDERQMKGSDRRKRERSNGRNNGKLLGKRSSLMMGRSWRRLWVKRSDCDSWEKRRGLKIER